MALVTVTSVNVHRNPATLFDPFELEVIFECLEDLMEDLEWKLIYVGSAESKLLDQELDCVVMGPIRRGALKFTFEADGPDFSKIPAADIHGFTILLLTGSYRDEEFIRIGWYVHNMYESQEIQDDPPDVPILEKMRRQVLTEAPRVTKFKIAWDVRKEIHFDESEIAYLTAEDILEDKPNVTPTTDASTVEGSMKSFTNNSQPHWGIGGHYPEQEFLGNRIGVLPPGPPALQSMVGYAALPPHRTVEQNLPWNQYESGIHQAAVCGSHVDVEMA